jgi:hypothetical protein
MVGKGIGRGVGKIAMGWRGAGASVIAAPVLAGVITLLGVAQIGGALTCPTGDWSGSPTGYDYQWRWADTNEVIAGATSSTFTVRAVDLDHTLACTVSATNAGGTTSVRSAATDPARLALYSNIVFYGDGVSSEGACPGVRNWPSWALLFLGGRVLPSGAWMQAKSGGDLTTITARMHCATDQAPDIFVVTSAGHNDGLVSSSYATYLPAWTAIVDGVIAALPSWAVIVVMLTLPSGVVAEATGGDWRATLRAAQTAIVQDRRATHGNRIILFDPYAAQGGFGPYDYTTHANASDGNVHLNAAGGYTVGRMFASLMTDRVVAASKDAVLADVSASARRGANVYGAWNLTGTAGAKSGTVAPTGNVATTHTLTNNLANGTSVAVVAAKIAQSGFEQQQIDVSGTPAATNTVKFARSSNATLTGATPGKYFAFMTGLRIDDGAGGAAVGPTNFGLTFGSMGNLFSTADLGAWGLAAVPAAIDTVAVCPGKAMFGNDQTAIAPAAEFRFGVASSDTEVVLDRWQVFELETLARRIPSYIGDDTIVGTNFQCRITGTGVTMTAGSLTGTVSAATAATLRAEPGNWAGGGLSFAAGWKRNGTTVSSAWTYAASGALTAGDTLTIDFVVGNTFGTTTRTITLTVT